jgi:protein-L-isoaspartate(D-aspartate) O-methyltransferase
MSGVLKDTYRTKGLRKQLIEELSAKGIESKAVLSAIYKVPRHFFIDSAFLEHAYQDKAFAIGQGQTISQPFIVAKQSELLELQPGHKVLEIGTGSGYQSAVLLEMGADLVSIEYSPVLHERALFTLRRMGYAQGRFKQGDGSLGWEEFAPYDGIIVTAGAPAIPGTLLKQLKIGGRLIIPVGPSQEQRMLRLVKLDERQVQQEDFGPCVFVPLLGKEGWK